MWRDWGLTCAVAVLIVLGMNYCSDRQHDADVARNTSQMDQLSRAISFGKLQQSCDAGELQACLDLARHYWQDKDTNWIENSEAESAFEKAIAIDPERTIALQQKACSGGDAVACAVLGIMYEAGDWVEKDAAKSLEYSKKACDLEDARACVTVCWKGDVAACLRMASLSWRCGGDERECGTIGDKACAQAFKVDRQRALELVQKNCGDGDLLACRCLAYAQVSPHVDLVGAELDLNRIARMLEEACDQAQAESCYVLGRYYEEWHLQTPRNIAKAVQAFERACRLGHAWGCTSAASHFRRGTGVAQDKGKAVEYEKKACDLGEKSACLKVKYDREAAARAAPGALAASLNACGKGDMSACVSAGTTYLEGKNTAKNAAEALRLFEKACSGGKGEVCRNLGLKFSKGIGVDRDRARGARFFKKACDLGDTWGCQEIGMMYIKGLGVPQDREKGLEFIKRGHALERDAHPAQP